MKGSQMTRQIIAVSLGCLLAQIVQGQQLRFNIPNVKITQNPVLLQPNEVPASGTFWLAYGEDGQPMPPFPVMPDPGADVYSIGNGQYLVDNSATVISAAANTSAAGGKAGTMSTMDDTQPPGIGNGGGSGGTNTSPPPDTRRNAQKFQEIRFTFLADTNDVSLGETNLYNILTRFPACTNPAPNLQILPDGPNAAVIKANHFDYSADSRNFALIICDRLEHPVWKNVDLAGSSDAQDGWLLAGTIGYSRFFVATTGEKRVGI
jgi:hypothetical protein